MEPNQAIEVYVTSLFIFLGELEHVNTDLETELPRRPVKTM